MTRYPELWAKLAAKFGPGELKKRRGTGKDFYYITARTVMNRLDEVIGPENWWDSYKPNERSVMCRLTIRLPDGSEITKCDAGGHAGMQDIGDDEKSGWSDAFKRAAVKFGIGRYLYEDGVPQFVRDTLALKKEQPVGVSPGKLPTTGRELYAWLLEKGQREGLDYIGATKDYGDTVGWPPKIIDWSVEQVAQALQTYTM